MKCCQLLLFTLLFTFLLADTPYCTSIAPPQDLIFSGKFHGDLFSTNPGPYREYTYLFRMDGYTIPASGFSITASVGQNMIGVSTSAGYDFSLDSYRTRGDFAQIVLKINRANSNNMIKILISYVVTSREDFSVGTFTVHDYQMTLVSSSAVHTYSGIEARKYTTTHILSDFSAQNQEVKAIAVLSGLKTSTSNISLITSDSYKIDTTTGTMTVTLYIQTTSPVQVLYLSYIWWVTDSLYGVGIGLLHNILDTNSFQYQYGGLMLIKKDNTHQYIGIGIGVRFERHYRCIGELCPSQCIIASDCINQQGVFTESGCFICGVGESIQGLSCQRTAPCGDGQYLSGSQCICNPNHFQVSSTRCVQCPEKSNWDGTSCVCFYNHYKSGNVCIICPVNSVYSDINKNCVCQSPLFWSNGACNSCGSDQIWNVVSSSCVCANGFVRINGFCHLDCPANQRWTASYLNISGVCVCRPPYSRVNGICSCPFNTIDQDGLCISNSPLTCPMFSNKVGNTCVCIPNFRMIDNQCRPCQGNLGSWC